MEDKELKNKEGLKLLYEENECAAALLDAFSEREKKATVSPVDRLLTVLQEKRKPAVRSQVIEVLKQLQNFGVGEFIAGRRGSVSRFRWKESLIDVGKLARGDDALSTDTRETEQAVEINPAVGENMIRHLYRLRPGNSVELVLPIDLTKGEAARLSEFIRTLPFDQV